MNWVIPVLQFAYGFFRGAQQGYTDRQAGRFSPGGHSSYDWHQHMTALAEATGATLLSIKARYATFDVPHHGQNYMTIVVPDGNVAVVSVCSSITFPQGCAPQGISAALERVNQNLEQCAYDMISSHRGDVYCVQSRIHLDRLSPEVFVAMINDLLIHVEMLDKHLLKNGFVR
jgi:hypothetical protein